MRTAARYADHYLLSEPGVVVLRAPTGYLKTTVVRSAAQRTRESVIVDCREVSSAADLQSALGQIARSAAIAEIERFIAFDNADALLANPPALEAVYDAMRRRTNRQTIAVCTRRPFPLPADLSCATVELTIEDLAVDVAAELRDSGLSDARIAEIRTLTLGWPSPTFRLAAIAATCPPGVPLPACASPQLERLLQDLKLDFIDRLPPSRRERLFNAHARDRDALLAYEPASDRDVLAAKLARAHGLLLRDGATYRVPAIVVAALDAEARCAAPATSSGAAVAETPAIAFDVLSEEMRVGGEPVRLPRREFELLVNLAVKARHVPYDDLLEDIWGDAGGDYARLKVTVGRVRKRFGSCTIRSVDGGYVIGAHVTSTLGELERATLAAEPLAADATERLEAIRLQHRRAAASVTRNWPWYTPWAAKIDGLVERALVALARHALGERRYRVALERAREAIGLNAVSQEAHEIALRALMAQGNAVGARQLLAAYTTTLSGALGIDVPDAISRIVRDVALFA